METLGYVYNRGAASLRRARADTIGVVVTNPANPFFGELLTALISTLDEVGHTCLLVATGTTDLDVQERGVRELRERQVAGIAIVPASGTSPDFVETLNAWRLPHVFMTRYVPEGETHYVGADDVRGGDLAASHLLSHDVRSAAYIGGPTTVLSRRDRLRGARAAFGRAGLDPDQVLADLPCETSGQGGFRAAEELIGRGPLPDGILCHSDDIAFGVYRALRLHGRHRDVPVIGYDDIATAALWEPPLTTIATHSVELGRLAARALLTQIDDGPRSPVVTLTEPDLVVRESCGCAAR